MMHTPRIFVASFLLPILSCSQQAEDAGSTTPDSENPRIPEEWKAEGIARVIGYRFRIPGEDEKGGHPTGHFTLCRDSTVDLRSLEKIQVNSAELNSEQIRRLVDLVFSDADPLPHVACYSPHQLFVFYDSEGLAKRAVEICFLCNGVRTVPPLPEAQQRRHDLRALAQLCDELGIWADYEKIEDYVPHSTPALSP